LTNLKRKNQVKPRPVGENVILQITKTSNKQLFNEKEKKPSSSKRKPIIITK
jgi:predicted kinase